MVVNCRLQWEGTALMRNIFCKNYHEESHINFAKTKGFLGALVRYAAKKPAPVRSKKASEAG
jgi:hypothetical protein